MRKDTFYALLFILMIIEVIQILFVLNFLEWFKAQGVYFVYPVLFSMSFVVLGIITFFLIKGIWSLKNRK